MENQSDSRILKSIRRLNEILSRFNNRVLLLDFSHFLAVSNQHANIIVKTCGLPQCSAEYEAELEKAYTAKGFIKYKVDEREREKFFVCDFPERDPVKPPFDYKFGPRRNLNRHEVEVQAKTSEALKWFDAVKASGMCGSGVVLARGTPGMQSNIYLFLEKRLGVKSPGAMQYDRGGKAKQGEAVAEETRDLLAQIFDELNELLRDEMEETVARLFRRYYSNVAFASHEIPNMELNIMNAEGLETAKTFGLALCITLRVGLDLGSSRKLNLKKVPIKDVTNILEAYRQEAKTVGASLTWLFPKSLRELERWQVFVIIEITRNAKKRLEGLSAPPVIHWDIDADEKGVLRMCCTSSPHLINPSVWPWRGSLDPESMKGTHFISRLAESEYYAVAWHPEPPAAGRDYWEAKFELTRNGESR
jgi:hypothetical protein